MMDNETGKKMNGRRDEMNAAGDLERIFSMTDEERDTEIALAQGALMELIDQLDKTIQNFTKMCQMYPVFKRTSMTKAKEDKIVKLLMEIQAIWEQEHPNQMLSMSVCKDYLSAFSLDDKKRYIFNRSVLKRC